MASKSPMLSKLKAISQEGQYILSHLFTACYIMEVLMYLDASDAKYKIF